MMTGRLARLALGVACGVTLSATCPGVSRAQIATGDVATRGLSPTDFPRARQLAPSVYSYEALRAGDPGGQMTTVSLIVITTDGVVVADGQGNLQQTKEMVDWIAKTTTQSIKYVVICSDHGDHTGGNAAFPVPRPRPHRRRSQRVIAEAARALHERGVPAFDLSRHALGVSH